MAGDLFLAGATGYIGQEILRQAVEGWAEGRVRALARSGRSTDEVRRAGAEPVRGDLLAPGPWQDAVRASTYVVHAAQPAAFGQRVSRRRARAYGRARLIMDSNLLDSVDRRTLRRLVYVSGNSYFGETGTADALDETMTRHPTGFGPYIEPAMAEVTGRIDAGLDAVIAVPAAVYGNGSWLREYTIDRLLADKPLMALRGRSRTISPVHVADVAGAVLHLLAVDAEVLHRQGRVFFVVDDRASTYAELNEQVAALLGRRVRTMTAPKWLLGLFAGSVSADYMATDARYSNARLKATGYRLRFPTIDTGLLDVLRGVQAKPLKSR